MIDPTSATGRMVPTTVSAGPVRILIPDISIVKINQRRSKYGRITAFGTEGTMIRFHLAAVLKRKGWTPYRLSQQTGLTVPTAYRLADPEIEFGRFTVDTLDRLCAALDVQPGELLEWVPDKRRRSERS